MMVLDYDRVTGAQRVAGDFGLLIARVPLGIYMFLAGLAKIQGGIGKFVESTSGLVPSYLPQSVGQAYLHAVPFAEVTVGACLVLGLLTRVTGLIETLMLISFTIAATGLKPLQGVGPFHTNVLLIGLAAAIALLGPGRISVDALLWNKKSP